MRLADLISNRQQLNNIQGANQTQAQPQTDTAALNRQLRSLTPGQTLQGEIVGKNGTDVTIKLSDNMNMSAKLEQNMNLEIGKLMTFEVKSNGQALSLSPLFANTATDANVLKALDLSLLPVNESTVAMTESMMQAGMSVDKRMLQQVYRELKANPNADITDIIDLHKLGLPVTEENVEQLKSYKNLTHQINDGMNEVAGKLSDAIGNMAQKGDIEGALKLFETIRGLLDEKGDEGSNVINEENAEEAKAEEGERTSGKTAVIVDESVKNQTMEEKSEASEGINGKRQTETAAGAADKALELLKALSEAKPDEKAENVNQKSEQTQAQKVSSENNGFNKGELAAKLKELTGKDIPADASEGELYELANEALSKAVAGGDKASVKELLTDKNFKNLLQGQIKDNYSIEPKDVAEPEKVEELYSKLKNQLKTISGALEQSGQSGTEAFKAVNNMSQNVDFMQQLNQMYAYVQLPLKLSQGDANGDLYVYTNKKNLARNDGKVTALLHLDMQHLGPVDVYVAMENNKVSTNFYVADDSILDFLNGHMDELTERLSRRGYDCSCNMSVRDKNAPIEGGVRSLLKEEEGHTPLIQYAFDVRA
ncbi:MAG: flagellar hook-length control protein FliK [Lachnospiraceae bacterium]|nr:flagellar hook-length control protein FliK [Lachnospiraceae bacterium]